MRTAKNAGFDHCIDKIERIVGHLEYQLHPGNLLHSYRKEEQVHNVLKLITQDERAEVKFISRANREDYESSRMPVATEKPAALIQERGASARSAQADVRKGLKFNSSQEPSARVKPAALVFVRK